MVVAGSDLKSTAFFLLWKIVSSFYQEVWVCHVNIRRASLPALCSTYTQQQGDKTTLTVEGIQFVLPKMQQLLRSSTKEHFESAFVNLHT